MGWQALFMPDPDADNSVLIRATLSPRRRYGLALGCVAGAALVRYAMVAGGMSDSSPYLLFALAVVAAAWYGGLGPGLMATVLSAVVVAGLVMRFDPPRNGLSGHLPGAAVFLALGVLVSWLGHVNRRTTALLQKMYQQMEGRVQRRTGELAASNAALVEEVAAGERQHAELLALNTRLEESNRELQDFASVASHDLQEPLRKVQAFGDRLGERYGERLEDAGRDYLDRMQKAAGRMQVLIDDLLTFSRVTSRGQPFIRVDLDRIAREVVSDLEARIEQVDGEVELASLPAIDADPLQMRQLLQNLIGNGLKFARPGVPSVVRVYAEEPDPASQAAPAMAGKAVSLCVSDNGIGFEEKYLDRIFHVFQRLHGRQAFEGTGIGLAICRKIANRHGGDITARSRPGHGATFIVTLPIRQVKEDVDDER